MSSVVTQAIVLRRVDYRDNDRILTLLSPELGKMEAAARGCKRPRSALLAASEMFCYGEYALFSGKGRTTVTSCALQDSFYPLRADFDRLTRATFLLNCAEAAAQPGEQSAQLFTLLLRSLSRLAYSQIDESAVTCAFLLHFSDILGFRPRLYHCADCGEELARGEGGILSFEAGGVVCRKCREKAPYGAWITGAERAWLSDIRAVGVEKTALPHEDAPLQAMRQYVETSLDRRLKSGRFLRNG